MNDFQAIHFVALFGWLILAVSGLAAYRLNAKKAVVMALIWAAIFIGVVGLFSVVVG